MVRCRVEWSDTDAAGHYHHSTAIRWVEAAEAALYRALGCESLFGVIPRIHYDVRYSARLWFGDVVEVGLRVTRVGSTSLTYAFDILREGVSAASGTMSVVHTAGSGAGSQPWPADVRRNFEQAGRQLAVEQDSSAV
jgi:YbgC/YbaW family acyl-CoA thioester hydrolase